MFHKSVVQQLLHHRVVAVHPGADRDPRRAAHESAAALPRAAARPHLRALRAQPRSPPASRGRSCCSRCRPRAGVRSTPCCRRSASRSPRRLAGRPERRDVDDVRHPHLEVPGLSRSSSCSPASRACPRSSYEAAALDGAGWWKTQWYITVPLLGPTIRIWAFLSIIGSLQLFDMVWIVTGGGPLNASSTMAVYMVKYGLNVSRSASAAPSPSSCSSSPSSSRSATSASRCAATSRVASREGNASDRHHRHSPAIEGTRAEGAEPASRRIDWSQPVVYVVALAVVAVAIGPVIYVFISGFRTNPDFFTRSGRPAQPVDRRELRARAGRPELLEPGAREHRDAPWARPSASCSSASWPRS